MRDASDEYGPALAASHRIRTRIDSWRGGTRLASSVPYSTATLSFDDTATMRRELSLTVPMNEPDGSNWDPADRPSAALGAYGQRLHVRVGMQHPTGTTEWSNLGWYLITGWERELTERTVEVTATDLAQLIEDARHYDAESPADGATYPQEFVRLIDGILPTWIDPRLNQTRAVSDQAVWERDRTRNLDTLCEAWGARWFVDDDGRVCAAPVYENVTPDTPYDVRVTGGRNGTLVGRSRAMERERLYNAVVATGKAADDPEGDPAPWAAAEITDAASPIRVGGPYGRKPRFYQSDLLTTTAECRETAAGLLYPASAQARTDPIEAVPDYRLELGDVVSVVSEGREWRGRIQSMELPLTGVDGAMSLELANRPEDEDEEGEGT